MAEQSFRFSREQQMFVAAIARDMAHGDLTAAATLLLSVGVSVILASKLRTDSQVREDVARLVDGVIARWRGVP